MDRKTVIWPTVKVLPCNQTDSGSNRIGLGGMKDKLSENGSQNGNMTNC